MANFFQALFLGPAGSNLTTYVPEVGVFTAPVNIDLDDGVTWFKGPTNLSLQILELDGAGGANGNWVVDTDPPVALLHLVNPPTFNYQIAVPHGVNLDPANTVDDKVFLALRAFNGTGDFVNVAGVEFDFNGDNTLTVYTLFSNNGSTTTVPRFTSGPYPPGNIQITLGAAVQGNKLYLYVDGQLVAAPITLNSIYNAAPGGAYLGFEPNSSLYNASTYLTPLNSVTVASYASSTLLPTITLYSVGNRNQVPGVGFDALIFRVLDQYNSPMAGLPVTFGVLAGNSVYAGGATAVTDAGGYATMPTLTAGSVLGDFYISATVGAAVAYTPLAVVNPSVATALQVVSGGNQAANVSTVFSQNLVVKVLNAANGPIVGATLGVTLPGGASATLTGSLVSNASGLVSVQATANATAGSYAVLFTHAGTNTASVGLTNADPTPTCTSLVRPVTAYQEPFQPSSDIAWNNAVRILSNHATGASCAMTSLLTTAALLCGRGFGFAIPLNAVITGYIFKLRTHSSVGTVNLYAALRMAGSPNKYPASYFTKTVQCTSGAFVQRTLGTSVDLWGNAPFTPAQVNDPNFSVCVFGVPNTTVTYFATDYLLSVCYRTPAGPGAQTAGALLYSEV